MPATLPGMSEPAEAKTRETAEQKREEVRASLEPLAEGERPGAVTVAAVVAALLAVANLALQLSGYQSSDGNATPFGGILFAVLMLAAAGGMWKSKYWAVLGFQAMLGITLVVCLLSLIRAASVQAFAIPIAIIVLGGWLFWKLIRAMARIQMPRRPGRPD